MGCITIGLPCGRCQGKTRPTGILPVVVLSQGSQAELLALANEQKLLCSPLTGGKFGVQNPTTVGLGAADGCWAGQAQCGVVRW